jgi:hypothetical protein
VPSQRRRDFRESYGFWLGAGAALIILGAIPIGVTATPAISDGINPWTSAWFIFGFVVVSLGTLGILWALILYLARQQAGLWYPNSQGSATGSDRVLPGPSGSASGLPIVGSSSSTDLDAQWLRSTLRGIKSGLLEAETHLCRAQRTGRYEGGAGLFTGRVWKKNQRKLAELPSLDSMYDDLLLAFDHIKRINYFYLTRVFSRRIVRSDDNLPDATAAVRRARTAVEQQLLELG